MAKTPDDYHGGGERASMLSGSLHAPFLVKSEEMAALTCRSRELQAINISLCPPLHCKVTRLGQSLLVISTRR